MTDELWEMQEEHDRNAREEIMEPWWIYIGDGGNNRQYWVYQSPEGDYVCVKNPQWEGDTNDDGDMIHSATWDELTVIESNDERPATQDEKDNWWDDLRDMVEDDLNSSYSGF